VRLLAIWTLVGVGAAFLPPFAFLWGAGGLLLFALALTDLVALRRTAIPAAEREVPAALPLGDWSRVRMRLHNPSRLAIRLELFDHHPFAAETEGMPRELVAPARGWVELEYRLRPTARGDQRFGPPELRLASPARLWQRRVRSGSENRVRVLPNFRMVSRYALLALDDRLGQMGIKIARRRGEGLEFRELREYRPGDSLRRVDWKASARRQQLVSREYEDEKNQQVVFLVDCGRRMRAKDGDLTHFDHVLNTILLLSYVALRQGDSVGVLTFGGVDRWIPPVKGPAGQAAIISGIFDLETTLEPPDYGVAATRLMALQRRRALIILVSNLRDEDQTEILPALELLRRRNLVLLASLRESILAEAAARPIHDLHDALRVASAHAYVAARARVHEKFRGRGLLALDVEPEELPVKVVNRYLDIKKSGLL
jgi:uncharacterized protein (DUF58 family)